MMKLLFMIQSWIFFVLKKKFTWVWSPGVIRDFYVVNFFFLIMSCFVITRDLCWGSFLHLLERKSQCIFLLIFSLLKFSLKPSQKLSEYKFFDYLIEKSNKTQEKKNKFMQVVYFFHSLLFHWKFISILWYSYFSHPQKLA